MDCVVDSLNSIVVGVGSEEVGNEDEFEVGAGVESAEGWGGEDLVSFGLGADCCADAVACFQGLNDNMVADMAIGASD